MKWSVVTTAIYTNRDRIHYLDDSCRKHGIELTPFGIGGIYYGWVRTLMDVTLPGIESVDATHILCVDGIDSLIVAPMDEIISKYEALGSPSCLMSTERNMFPNCREAELFGDSVWRFPNGGNFMGDKQYILDMWRRLYPKYPQESAYQGWIINEWPIEGLKLDTGCSVFQTMDIAPEETGIHNGRLMNRVTLSQPCVLHFAGGYVDQKTGRDERMKPWVMKLNAV